MAKLSDPHNGDLNTSRNEPSSSPERGDGPPAMNDQEWRERLGEARFDVLRRGATERPFTGEYWDNKSTGIYRCAGCGAKLFDSTAQYSSGCGWPSFRNALPETIVMRHDDSHGMTRVEVLCRGCGGHLGHLFPDGPPPTGERYCINSLALDLRAQDTKSSKQPR